MNYSGHIIEAQTWQGLYSSRTSVMKRRFGHSSYNRITILGLTWHIKWRTVKTSRILQINETLLEAPSLH